MHCHDEKQGCFLGSRKAGCFESAWFSQDSCTGHCKQPYRKMMSYVCFSFCTKDDKYPVISKTRHIKLTRLHRKQVLNTSDGKMVGGVEVKLGENKQSLQTL